MQNNILDNHYNIITQLSNNITSDVYLVININDGNQYAAKIKRQGDFQHELQMAPWHQD